LIEYATYYRFRRARLWRTKCVEDLPTRHGKSVKARRMILKLTFMANDTATQQVTQIVEQAVYQLEQLQQQEQLARFNARYELQ